MLLLTRVKISTPTNKQSTLKKSSRNEALNKPTGKEAEGAAQVEALYLCNPHIGILAIERWLKAIIRKVC